MANKLSREQKIQLGELIGTGHRHFGKVTPRRPYAKEDESGTGTAQLMPEHPLLMRQPIGASSDLTFLVNENSFSEDKAVERADELKHELRNALEKKLGHELAPKLPAAPEAKMY